MGNVYVFNICSETLDSLRLNGLSAGTIPGWSQPGYKSQGLAAGRVLNASQSPGKFVNGRNNIVLAWSSGVFSLVVPIDGGQFPLNQDLLLYVCRNKWTLYNDFGVLVGEGAIMSVSD